MRIYFSEILQIFFSHIPDLDELHDGVHDVAHVPRLDLVQVLAHVQALEVPAANRRSVSGRC